MNKSNQNRREQIFKLFSRNLEWVKEHPSVSFEPDFSNGYICPLCFNAFDIEEIESKAKNPLTLEDVPPKSLGGNVMTLTCKSCNSISGHKLDNHLLNMILELDSFSFLPNSQSDVKFKLNGNDVNGLLAVDQQGKLTIDIQTKRSNPSNVDKFNREMFRPLPEFKQQYSSIKQSDTHIETPPFKVGFKKKSDDQRVRIALLRIGYLMAYSKLGNGFYINGNLFKIREQIQNPDLNIIPNSFLINFEFPKRMEGINIITKPKQLQSFLIIFRLVSKSKSRQYAVILPGPSKPGLSVYDNLIKTINESGDKKYLDFEAITIHCDNFLKEKRFAFESNSIWEKFTKQ